MPCATPSAGDHIRVTRGLYAHHGIYLGDDHVIHFSGVSRGKDAATIRATTLERFAAGSPVVVVPYANAAPAVVVVARAVSRIGSSGYNLFGNNCEHFARWCKTGQHFSSQVEVATAHVAGAGGGAGATAIGIGLVSSAGLAAGLSGAGMMSGLASVGGAIGAGAAAGIPIVGALPAVVATASMHRAFRDDPALPQRERDARRNARAGATIGSVGGAGAALATVSALGLPGLSAAGITSGLAVIGSTFGGGMLAGLVVAVAAPAMLALAASNLVYRWFTKRGPA